MRPFIHNVANKADTHPSGVRRRRRSGASCAGSLLTPPRRRVRETHVKLVIQLLDYRCAPKRMSVDGDLHQVCGTENTNKNFVNPRMFGGDIIGCHEFESGGGSAVSERSEQLTDRVDEANFGGPSRTDDDSEGLPLSRLLACGHVHVESVSLR